MYVGFHAKCAKQPVIHLKTSGAREQHSAMPQIARLKRGADRQVQGKPAIPLGDMEETIRWNITLDRLLEDIERAA